MEHLKNNHELPVEEQISSEDEIVKLATAKKWAEILGVGIQDVRTSLYRDRIIGITGRNAEGRLLPKAYYAEDQVREACMHLLSSPLSSEGIGHIDGYPVIGIFAYATHLRIKPIKLRNEMEEKGFTSVGRLRCGERVVDVYRKDQVDTLSIVQSLSLCIDQRGMVLKDGKALVSLSSYAMHRKVSEITLAKKVKMKGIVPAARGRSIFSIVDLYEQDSVDPIIQEMLDARTGISMDDWLKKNGEEKAQEHLFKSIPAWSRELEIGEGAIRRRLTELGILPITEGTDYPRINAGLYHEDDVRRACADVLHPQSNEEGIVVIGSEEGICVNQYSLHLHISESILRKEIENAQLPIIGKARRVACVVDVYSKKDVDALACVRRARCEGKAILHNGIGMQEDVEVISVYQYGSYRGVSPAHLREYIERAGIEPVGWGLTGRRSVPVYEKSKIDVLPPLASTLPLLEGNLGEDGIFSDGNRSYIGPHKYALARRISPSTINEAIREAGLEPIARVRSGKQKVPVYDKASVDALHCFFSRDEHGIVELQDSQGIILTRYAIMLGVRHESLQRWVDAAGIQPIGIGKGQLPYYPKDLVDELPEVQRAANRKDIAIPETGIVEHDGMTGIVIFPYSKYIQYAYPSLQKRILDAALNPLFYIRSGCQYCGVYDKDAVDALIPFRMDIPESGIISHDGKNLVTVSRYVQYLGMKRLPMAEIEKAKLPVVVSIGPIDFYEKDMVDALLFMQKKEETIDERGIGILDGNEVIGVTAYARFRRIGYYSLFSAIENAQLRSMGKMHSGKIKVDVFLKSEVDTLPCFLFVGTDGTVVLNDTVGIGIGAYAQCRGVGFECLANAVSQASLPIIGYARAGSRTVPIFEKEAVDRLPCFSQKADKNGLVIINGEAFISIKKYAACRGVSNITLQKAVQEEGIQSLHEANSGSQRIKLYRKSEIDELIKRKADRWKNIKPDDTDLDRTGS